jgi:hypothetical protein
MRQVISGTVSVNLVSTVQNQTRQIRSATVSISIVEIAVNIFKMPVDMLAQDRDNNKIK